FEEGVAMTKVCQEALTAADLKVEQLMKISNDGKAETKNFGS
ncbi:MAG: exodeoxyribonuclease VII small subunit, partial [Proteobacteria bacterium]